MSRLSSAPMIEIGDTIVSRDLLNKAFVCDLEACKGACCVQGDSGAPLEEDERAILDEEYDVIKPYLIDEGRKAIDLSNLCDIAYAL